MLVKYCEVGNLVNCGLFFTKPLGVVPMKIALQKEGDASTNLLIIAEISSKLPFFLVETRFCTLSCIPP